jgi:hypothetical protein
MNNVSINSVLQPENLPELQLLAAKLGLAGHVIRRHKNGYFVHRLNLVMYCKDHAELVAFSKKVGVLK